MKMSYKPRRRPPNENNPLVNLSIHIPRGTAEILKKLSEERDLPISKLVCYAVDNELDCEPTFNFETPLPKGDYREFEYAEEAAKILKYLMQHFQRPGTGLDMLMLCRRDFGIESKERLLLGFRELLEKKMIEEFYPHNVKFRYGKGYKYYRPSRDVIEESKVRKNSAIRKINSSLAKGPLYDSTNDPEEK